MNARYSLTNEKALSKAEIITLLTKSVHAGGASKPRVKGQKLPKLTPEQKIEARVKQFASYAKIGSVAVREDEHFYARLVAWNHQKGTVRDAKVALPVIGLTTSDPELLESNLAHLADLRPREFLRALEFAKHLGFKRNVVRRLAERWLRDLEANAGEWQRTALLHKDTLRTIYARGHVKPCAEADAILFKGIYHPESRFARVKALKDQNAETISGTIASLKLPWLIVRGALGTKLSEPDVLAAAIKGMTANELVNNMTALEKLGVRTSPVTRAALEQALASASTGKGAGKALLKASKAAAVVEDEVLGGKLKALQEKQLDAQKGIDGDWLICADKSQSMNESIEGAKQIASVLARLVRGKVLLAFFNNTPTFYDVTGKTLDEIQTMTRHERATGGTLIGTPLVAITDKRQSVDGIVVVSDGGDNRPGNFKEGYDRYVRTLGNEPTVYFYKVKGQDPDRISTTMDMQTFDLTGGVDWVSLPNLVATMRVGRFSLLDEVMGTALRTLDEVLDRTRGQRVIVAVKELAHA